MRHVLLTDIPETVKWPPLFARSDDLKKSTQYIIALTY